MDAAGRSAPNHPLKQQRDEDAMSSKRDEPGDSFPGNKQYDVSRWGGGGGGGGQYHYPQQPSFQQQQQALYQAQQQQQQQQQQGRGGEPQTPQYPPADLGMFGNASSSFSAELARHLANTPGGFGGMLHPSQQTPGGGGMMGGMGGGSGGAFSTFGQTPMAGASSFGMSSVEGNLPTPQQTAGILRGSSYGGIGQPGSGGGMSQLDNKGGMGGIQPTPISLRGRPYQMTQLLNRCSNNSNIISN